MELFLNLVMGIGLSAACGFRVFVPLLAMSLASRSGHLALSSNFDWIASDAALITLATATVLEIVAYYVPWIDNLLDTIATPLAVLAGIVTTAAVVTDINPYFKWLLAIIAGGGAAGLVQGTTVLTRGASTAGTGGLANPILATAEWGGSAVTSLASIFVPLLALILLAVFMLILGRTWGRGRKPEPTPATSLTPE